MFVSEKQGSRVFFKFNNSPLTESAIFKADKLYYNHVSGSDKYSLKGQQTRLCIHLNKTENEMYWVSNIMDKE